MAAIKSIEEKAKAYDEALRVLHKYDGVNILFSQSLKEEMFPELADSEDERIRKGIVKYLEQSQFGEEHYQIDDDIVRDYIAWLEKQGELKQKHFELKAGHWYICHRAFCCRADHLTVKEGERFLCEKDNVVKGFVIKEPEKYFKEISTPAAIETEQKSDITDDCKITPYGEKRDFGYFDKQKSSDKTPYPETLEKAIDLYYYSYGNGEGEFEHLSLEKFRDIVHTFVSDYGQKPWSEEDERNFDIIYGIIYNSCNAEDASRLIAWLKAIKSRVQPQLKPERSEEDEKLINSVIELIDNGALDRDEKDFFIEKLKSLRPQKQWKPSDEQMNDLNDVISSRGIKYDVLSELWKDLKKL